MKFGNHSNESYYEQLRGVLRKVRPHGHYFSALCPLHDDNSPSLLVYPDGFKCMACNRSGSLAQLFQAASRKSRKLSAKYLSELTPINLSYQNPNKLSDEELTWLAHDTLIAFPQQAAYLRERRVEGQIETAHIGWWSGYYTFPAFGEDDTFLACAKRASRITQDITGERWLPCKPVLYVPNWPLFLRGEKIYIVFGIFDALSLSELGVPVCSSTLGKNFSAEWLKDYRTKKFLVVPDKGEEEEARRLIAELGWRGEKVIQLDYPPGTKDPSDLHEKGCERYLLSQL